MESAQSEQIMAKVKEIFESSGLSLEQLGQQMGYGEGTARRAAWQFLNKTNDPRLSMICKFAAAVGMSPAEILNESDRED